MSTKVCSCGTVGLGNLGTPNCQNVASVTRKVIVVPYYDSTGAINGIDLSANPALDKAWFESMLFNADKSKRWQITAPMKNVVDERADTIVESFEDGTEVPIQDGARTFLGLSIKQATTYLGKLEEAGCSDVGVWLLDKNGNLVGSISDDGTFLNPIKVQANTWKPRLIKTTDTTTQKIELKFTFDDTEADRCLKVIAASEMATNPLNLVSMIDANGILSVPTTTSFTGTITSDYGTALTKDRIEGLVLANFELKINGVVVAISSVTESTPGVYNFVMPAAASTDVIELGIVPGIRYEFATKPTIAVP